MRHPSGNMAKPPSPEPLSCVETARCSVNKATRRRIRKALAADRGIDLSAVLSRELAKYPASVDDEARSRRRAQLMAESARLEFALPTFPASEIAVIHPISDTVQEYVLGKGPQRPPDEAPRDAVETGLETPPQSTCWSAMDELLRNLRSMVEEGPEILYASPTTLIFGLASWLVLKVSDCLDAEDVANANFVAHCVPEVPMPWILGAFHAAQRKWVIMSRAPGVTLESVWQDLTAAQKLSVQYQLNSIYKALGQCTSLPPGFQRRLGSVAGGICTDARRRPRASQGSILSEREFNDFLCDAPRPRAKTWLRSVMTHANLHPRNILVSWEDAMDKGAAGPGDRPLVTAVLGWEKAGWYPEYWEYARAVAAARRLRGPLGDWADYLPTDAIGRYMAEYAVDSLLDERHG